MVSRHVRAIAAWPKRPGSDCACGSSPPSSVSSICGTARRSNGRRSNAATCWSRDRDGNWTYQFAATVDDYVQGVTLVIRGDDLLESTGRQMQLARLLGRAEPPEFLHHPLIMKSADQKLSKSDGDTGVRDLRARGWTPAQVIRHARR